MVDRCRGHQMQQRAPGGPCNERDVVALVSGRRQSAQLHAIRQAHDDDE
jgi:hypothetical protein